MDETAAYIRQQMAENDVTGLAVALVDAQQVVWVRGFGYADKVAGLPVTSNTVFRIGSVSKTFTAAMVLQLADRGLVNLDDPLSRYIPGFSVGAPLAPYASAGGPITIRTILTQHSGIPGDQLWYGVFTSNPHTDFTSRLIDSLQGEHAQFPTDFFFSYSNAGVALLADVIEAVSGASFLDYSREFLQLLGMNRSSFNRDDPSVATGQTGTYGGGYALSDGYVPPLAAGSMVASVEDMTKYIRMILAGGIAENGRVLRPETFEAMVAPQNTGVALDCDSRIGYIWWLSEPDLAYAGRICQHGGDTTLSHSSVKILLDQQLGVVVLTNSFKGSTIKDNIAVKTLQLAVEAKAGLRYAPFVPAFSPVVEWSQDRLDAVAGIYIPVVPADYLYAGALTASRYDKIERSGGGLAWIQDAGGSAPIVTNLVPRANGRFSAPNSQETEYQFRTESGRNVIVSHYKGFRRLLADRYDPLPVPAAWAARVGTYALVDMDSDYLVRSFPGYRESNYAKTLAVKDGIMVFGSTPLAPVSDTKAYRPGLARDLGTAVRVVMVNNEELITLGGYRYRRG
jgi:CubicO group peptidase (beta-lactamase class C family)